LPMLEIAGRMVQVVPGITAAQDARIGYS
jgi:hypothetical protein